MKRVLLTCTIILLLAIGIHTAYHHRTDAGTASSAVSDTATRSSHPSGTTGYGVSDTDSLLRAHAEPQRASVLKKIKYVFE